MNKNIKMIVTDLDNTLLRRDKTVSDYTASAFKRLRECGVVVAFATARYFRTVEEWVIPSIGIQPDIVISLNGAYAYANGRPLYQSTFSPDIGNALVTAVHKAGGMVTVGTDRIRYCERVIEDSHKSFSVACKFDEPIDENFHYMDLRGVDSAALEKIAGNFPTLRIQAYTDSALVTFQHIDARKETALSAVMEQLNILPREVVAFGDDRNDIEMLRVCGFKVAVANALDEVKAVTDYVCGDCDEDGVARWIEENVFNNGGKRRY